MPIATEAVDALLQKRSGMGLQINAAGVPVLGVYRYIPALNWGLAIEFDQGRALGAANQLVRDLRLYLLQFARITDSVNNVARITEENAAATEQMAAHSDEVAAAMQNVAALSEEAV